MKLSLRSKIILLIAYVFFLLLLVTGCGSGMPTLAEPPPMRSIWIVFSNQNPSDARIYVRDDGRETYLGNATSFAEPQQRLYRLYMDQISFRIHLFADGDIMTQQYMVNPGDLVTLRVGSTPATTFIFVERVGYEQEARDSAA